MKFRLTFLGVLASIGVSLGCTTNVAQLKVTGGANSFPSKAERAPAPVKTPIPASAQRYTGPIVMAIDPSLSGAKGRRMLLSYDGSHHKSHAGHVKDRQEKYFDPTDPASLQSVEPSNGDSEFSSPDGAVRVSSTKINQLPFAFNFVSQQVIVSPKVSEDILLEKLRKTFVVDVVGRQGNSLLLKFELSNIDLSTIPGDLQYFNSVNSEPIKEISFSSLNGAKMCALLMDLLIRYQDVVEIAEWNTVTSPIGWSPNVIDNSVMAEGTWWLNRTNTFDAWKYSIGSNVKLAIIDDGFSLNNHPELSRRVKWKGYPRGDTFVYGDVDGVSHWGGSSAYHGNMVALVAAGERNNRVGTTGIAPNVDLMALRTFGAWDVDNAIRFAADNGAKVINISSEVQNTWRFFGFSGRTVNASAIDSAINESMALHPDLVIVAGAGNSSTDVVYSSPQDRSDVIVVGGLEHNKMTTGLETEYSTYSNFGNHVDIWAPCEGIEVASFTGSGANQELNGGDPHLLRQEAEGTSSSGPVIAATVALMKSRYSEMTVAEAIDILRSTATTTYDSHQMVNVTAAVEEALRRKHSLDFWKARDYTGIISKTNDDTYYLALNGNNYQLENSVPTGTYQQFIDNAPPSSKNQAGNIYITITGWLKTGTIEVQNIVYATAPTPSSTPAPPANYKVTVGKFYWVGLDQDKVSNWNYGSDGTPDGHFKLTLHFTSETVVKSITMYTMDANGQKCCGQVWDTQSPLWWLLAVFSGDIPIQTEHTVAPYFATFYPTGTTYFDLELNGSNSGFFNPGQRFLVEIILDDGTVVSETTTI